MWENILTSVLGGVILLFVGAVVGRISVKSKTALEVDELNARLKATRREFDEYIKASEERNEIILDSLLAILLTLKRGKCNGEADEALNRLNSYMLHQSGKN